MMEEKHREEKHIIEDAVFDFTFAPECAKEAEAEVLGPLIQEMLLPIVDEVFSEVSLLREGYINQLTIDLGIIDAAYFKEGLQDHLRLRLKSALEAQLPLRHSDPSMAKKAQMPDYELGLYEIFLIKGHLPSKHLLEKGRTMDEILSAVLVTSAGGFARFLRKSKHQPQVLKRLIYQSSEENLTKIVRLLSPTDADILFSFVKKLKRRLAQISKNILPDRVLDHEIWQVLFTFLLKENSGQIEVKHLIDLLKQRLAAGNRTREKQLTEALRNLHVFTASSTSDPLNPVEENPKKAEMFEVLAQLNRDLRTAVQEANPAALQKIWQRVLRDHAGLLKGILLDLGRAIAVRRVLSRRLSDGMLHDIVGVIDPDSQAFVHEIVTRPALFMQMNSKQIESEDETRYQLWEFTLSYLIIERGSHFNKKSYLGSLLAQMAAHENSSYADLLQGLIVRLHEIEISSGVKSEMRDLLFSLVREDQTNKALPLSSVPDEVRHKKQLALIQAYDDYEILRRAFFAQRHEVGPRPNEEAVVVALESLTGLSPTLLMQLFRRLQVEAHAVEAYHHGFSAQILLKFIKTFVSFRLHSVSGSAQSDFMQSVEKHVSDQKDLKYYYAQILFCLIQNVLIDFEAIFESGRTLPQADSKVAEKEKNLGIAADEEASLDLLRTKVTEAMVRGRPQTVQDFWPLFIKTQGTWLRQALLVYGREAEVRKKLSKTFPDVMLLDMVHLITPEAGKIVSEIVKQPHLFQGRSSVLESKKEAKATLWEYSLSYLLAERGSRFNKKSYLNRLISQMAAHRNIRAKDILVSLTEGFEIIEASRVAKSEMLHILRELSQESDLQKPEMKVVSSGNTLVSDVDSACRDLKYFLSQGAWPKNYRGDHAADTFLKMIKRLFQSHRPSLSRLFAKLQTAGLFRGGQMIDCPPEIFVHLIEVALSLKNSEGISATSEFMQTMMRCALKTDNQSLYYQKIFACLIANRVVDFEVILSQCWAAETERLSETAGESDSVEAKDSDSHIFATSKTRLEIAASVSSPPSPQKDLSSETLLEADFALFEKILNSTVVLSAQALRHFIATIKKLLLRAPKALATRLRQRLEQRASAHRLIHLLPESLLVRLLFLLNPVVFDSVVRISHLIASAACAQEIALSPARISRLKWQLMFRYFFEEGRHFHVKTFVSLFTDALARDAYYADVAAFRLLLRRQLESHQIVGIKNEVLPLMDTLSQIDRAKPSDQSLSEKNTSIEIPAETPTYFDEIEEEWDETIHLRNAGLVIAGPYLERFFALLDLTEGRVFKNPEAAQRGVHLLQFLVDERTDTPEYELVLNKILCGLKPAIPIERDIHVSAHEKEVIEGLLKGMISHWKQIGETSLQGFRESFLQREGILRRKGDDWQLQVSAKAFDILLDYIPWSFSLVKLPWMQRVIHVKWRSGEGT